MKIAHKPLVKHGYKVLYVMFKFNNERNWKNSQNKIKTLLSIP